MQSRIRKTSIFTFIAEKYNFPATGLTGVIEQFLDLFRNYKPLLPLNEDLLCCQKADEGFEAIVSGGDSCTGYEWLKVKFGSKLYAILHVYECLTTI